MDVCVSNNVLIMSSLDVNSLCQKEIFSCRISSAFFSVLYILLRRSNNDSILFFRDVFSSKIDKIIFSKEA